MIRRGAAAAPHEPGSHIDEAPGVLGHVVWAGHVDAPIPHGPGKAGVGLGRQGEGGPLAHDVQGVQDDGWAHGAVQPDDLGPQPVQLHRQVLRIGAVGGAEVGADGHLGHHREVAEGSDRPVGRLDLVHVGERLQDEPVHLPLQEPLHLTAEIVLGLVDGRGSPRLDTDPQGANGARHQDPGGRPPGQAGRFPVDLPGLLLQPVGRELHRVGPEGVGLHDLGPGGGVFGVDPGHQLRLLQDQGIVADVDEHPPGVEEGSHGPVQDVDPAVVHQVPEGGSGRHGVYPRLGESQRSTSSTGDPVRAA